MKLVAEQQPLKDVYVLVLGLSEYIALLGKWDLEDMVKDIEMRTFFWIVQVDPVKLRVSL